MEVILLESVRKLGKAGETVRVKDGYARNFLLPTGKVLRATNQNKAIYETKRAEIEKQNADKRSAAEKLSQKVEGQFVTIIRQAGDDGRLFGSVSARDIAAEIEKLGVTIDRTQVVLDKPVKYIGVYPERVELHPEVIVKVNVNVARSTDEAEEAKKDFLNPKPKKGEAAEAELVEEAPSEQAPEASEAAQA